MYVNKCILVGNLGKDPEVKEISPGNTVANFTMATNEKYKNRDGEMVSKTEWHNIVAWGKNAENIERYCSKGSQLYIEGKLQTRSWEDADGKKRYMTEIMVDRFQFGANPNTTAPGSQNQGSQQSRSTQVQDAEPIEENEDFGDLPF